MYFLKKKKILLLSATLMIFLFSLPIISQSGFIFSEYLSKQPGVNYILAISLSMVGFINSYSQLTRYKKLNVNRAIRAYLSFGFGMSGVYYLMYTSHLRCFSLPPDITESASIIDFIYFSFVTVTTVGYGDIVPRHTFVRALVLFQVLFAIILVLRVPQFNKEST